MFDDVRYPISCKKDTTWIDAKSILRMGPSSSLLQSFRAENTLSEPTDSLARAA